MFHHSGRCCHDRLLSCLFEVGRGVMTVVEDLPVSDTRLLTKNYYGLARICNKYFNLNFDGQT